MSNKFEVLSAKLIGAWSYKLQNTDCAICYASISSSSVPDLQRGKESYVVVGKCGHSFHSGCLGPWLKSNPRCPLCSCHWEDKTPPVLNNRNNSNFCIIAENIKEKTC